MIRENKIMRGLKPTRAGLDFKWCKPSERKSLETLGILSLCSAEKDAGDFYLTCLA